MKSLEPLRALFHLSFLGWFTTWLFTCISFAATAKSPPAPDVRLVIDVSGSMKRNDPNDLRQPAVELLVKLLPEDSRAGIWTFGRQVNMLVKHGDVDNAWRQNALEAQSGINSVGLFTNIGEALEGATYDASRTGASFRRSVILLTDGMVDIDRDDDVNQREWRRIADELLPILADTDIAVHTIALSDNADRDLLNKIALQTDGVAAVAKTADELLKVFLRVFEAAAPSEEVPLSEEGFAIDSSVKEFTALLFREDPQSQTALIAPDRQRYDAGSDDSRVSWHRTEIYDLITVKEPLEGQWQLRGAIDPESRVTVVSNLNLRLDPVPNNFLVDTVPKLNFRLQEDGRKVTDSEFLSLMQVEAALAGGNGAEALTELWQQDIAMVPVPESGVYALALPALQRVGHYRLTLRLDGKTFNRQLNRSFRVRRSFGADIRDQWTDGDVEYILTVQSFAPNIDPQSTQVVATVSGPESRKNIIPLSLSETDTWRASIRPGSEGEYRVLVRARGKSMDGKPFDQSLTPINFNFSADSGFAPSPESFVENTPSPTATPEPPAPTPMTEEPPVSAPNVKATPKWLLYSALALGNLILLALGFLAYRKITSAPDASVLEEFSEEAVAGEAAPSQPEAKAEDGPEEEPPMEDIDPQPEPPVVPPPMVEEVAPKPEVTEPEASKAIEELDDLDQMAETKAPKSADASPQEIKADSDEDVASSMLKAEGLDLAEEELDDAINSLIDELESDDDRKPPDGA